MGARDVVFTILAIDQASARLARVGSEAEVLGGKMGKSGRIVGNAMNLIGLATAAVAVKSIELGAKFQSTMEQLTTQAHVPQKQVDSLSQSVLNLAGKVGEGPDSLAEALYHIESSFASTGITGAKAMHLLETASKGAKVGHADLVDVTNALDAAVVSGIPGVKNFDQAMGMLNATVGAGDMHMQDLADAFGTGAVAVVKNYGLSLRDVGSALAVFGDNNIRGAEAGTALRMTVQSLAVPAKTGAKALEELGLSQDTLAKDMQSGGLIKAVADLHERLDKAGLSGKQSGQVLTEAFGKKAGVGLAMLVDQFDRLKSKYVEVDKGAKTFGDSWKDQQKTLLQQWDQLKDGAEALFTKIGLKLIPVVLDLGKKFGDAGDKLKPVVNFIEQHSTIFGSVAAEIGTVIAAVKIWTMVTKAFAVVQAAVDVILAANPIGIVVIAIAGLAAMIIYAYKNSETFRNIVTKVWDVLKVVVVTGAKGIADAIMGMAGIILHAADFAFGWIPGIGPKLHSAVSAFDKFRDGVNAALDGILKNTVANVDVNVRVNGKPVNVHGNALAGFNMTSRGGGHTQTVRAFASGGRPAPGQPSLVGENGPELFWPDSAGTIIPNHQYAARSKNRHPHMVALGSSIISGVTDGLKQAAPKAYAFLRSFELKIADIKVSSNIRDGIKKAADRIGAQMVLTTGQVNDLTKRIADQKQAVADMFKQRDEYAQQLAQGVSGGSITNIGLTTQTTDAEGNTTNLTPQQQAAAFLDSMKARVRAIHTFNDDMSKLRAEGLSSDVLQQIAQSGLDTGGALAAALVTATPETIRGIDGMAAQIATSSDQFGKTWAGQMYNTGINAANGILKGLESKQADLLAMIRKMAQSVVDEIKRTLKIKSPSGVMADEVGAMIPAGIAAGMTANAHLVTTAARGLVPTAAGGYGVAGGKVAQVGRGGDTHVHIHMQNGIVGDAQQVATYVSDVIRRSNNRGSGLSFA